MCEVLWYFLFCFTCLPLNWIHDSTPPPPPWIVIRSLKTIYLVEPANQWRHLSPSLPDRWENSAYTHSMMFLLHQSFHCGSPLEIGNYFPVRKLLSYNLQELASVLLPTPLLSLHCSPPFLLSSYSVSKNAVSSEYQDYQYTARSLKGYTSVQGLLLRNGVYSWVLFC